MARLGLWGWKRKRTRGICRYEGWMRGIVQLLQTGEVWDLRGGN